MHSQFLSHHSEYIDVFLASDPPEEGEDAMAKIDKKYHHSLERAGHMNTTCRQVLYETLEREHTLTYDTGLSVKKVKLQNFQSPGDKFQEIWEKFQGNTEEKIAENAENFKKVVEWYLL